MAQSSGVHRRWRPPYALDLGQVAAPLHRGAADPAARWHAGALWRAVRTPEGIGTIRIAPCPSAGEVDATAWGDGAPWLLETVPAMLGTFDEPHTLVLPPGPLREVQRRNPGLRLGSTGLVMDSLIPAILEQKVTVLEARRAWHHLLRRFGTAAPGPLADLRVAPAARQWALIPSWDWHQAGVDPKRSATIQRAERPAPRLEEASAMNSQAATNRSSGTRSTRTRTACRTRSSITRARLSSERGGEPGDVRWGRVVNASVGRASDAVPWAGG
ncbi:DNA glycosylase family protein [Kitasatospora mediocidica]|uniref:DNA-3-methyladenine glycosylase 2 family protein n=1 Tax=Kitasatospora mediocidica TaxID=58352 RepID=UPI0012F7BD29|nr:DNA-3-methyladenine glycosylase 2 family protein [Kitasatospora mediocidica]